jgi:hypothetical protein
MELKPKKHQQELLDLNPDRHGIFFGTGTGKTLTALWLAEQKKSDSTLIVTKKNLVKKWNRDCAPFSIGEVVISKEEMKRDWNILDRFETLIIDEAHFFFGPLTRAKEDEEGKKTRNVTVAGSLMNYIRKNDPKHVYLLTATPYTSTPWNIYRAAKLLGKEWKYADFQNHFFDRKKRWCGKKRGMKEVWEAKETAEAKELIDVVTGRIGTVRKMEECSDIPEQNYRTVELELNTVQREAMKKVTAANSSSRHMLHARIEAGHVSGEGYEADQFFSCPVIEQVMEYAVEFPKMVVVCQFRLQMEHLKKELGDYKVLELTGSTKDGDAVVQEAEGLDRCVLLVQAACSEGYELPSFPVMVFAGMSNSYKDYVQMCGGGGAGGRLFRINRPKKNLYIFLISGKATKSTYECVSKHQDYDPAGYKG